MWLLPYAAQNYHPLLYHNYNKTCCLLVPPWIATHAHSVNHAGRLLWVVVTTLLARREATYWTTLTSDKERTLWRHIPALILLAKMLCNIYTQIKITEQKNSKLVIIKFALSVTPFLPHFFLHSAKNLRFHTERASVRKYYLWSGLEEEWHNCANVHEPTFWNAKTPSCRFSCFWYLLTQSGKCGFQWPRGLKSRSAAPWLLESGVGIPLRAWISVSCV